MYVLCIGSQGRLDITLIELPYLNKIIFLLLLLQWKICVVVGFCLSSWCDVI